MRREVGLTTANAAPRHIWLRPSQMTVRMGYPNRKGQRYSPSMMVFPHLMAHAMPAELTGRWDMTWGIFTPFERSRPQ